MGKVKAVAGSVMCALGIWMCYFSTFDIAFGPEYADSVAHTLGYGQGSLYRICGETGPAIEDFTSVDFATKPSVDVKHYMYNIQNPKKYLKGEEDAISVEKGPYMYTKHYVNHNVAFETSSLTEAAEPKATGKIVHDVASAYVVLDKDTTVTSSLQRSTADLSLSDTGSKVSIPHAKMMPDHLSMSDEVTSLSPEYQSVLGTFNDELSLVLSMSCTATQVENVLLAGPSNGGLLQCTDSQMNDNTAPNCACCMMADDYLALTVKNTGTEPNFKNCNTFMTDDNDVMSTISLHAMYDGGVAVKDAGDVMYDGSGSGFTSTAFGQTSFYSAAIQTHTVNERLFGHPSAFVGKVVPAALLSTAEQIHNETSHSKTEVAALMLTGQMDDDLPFKLGNVAEYTKKVGNVCSASCEAVGVSDPLRDSPMGWMCSGNAPERDQTSVLDEIVLGGIDCKPYSSTFATKMYCSAIATELTANPGSSGYEACVCADGSDDWSTGSGCCLAGGVHNGMDLTGGGCLYSVPGEVGTNYLGKDADASGSLDLGKAIEDYIATEESKPNALFMCPGAGEKLPEHYKFNHYELYEGSDSYTIYHDTGMPRMQQNDKMLHANHSVPHNVPVSSGGQARYYFPRGMQTQGGDLALTFGRSLQYDHMMYAGKYKSSFAYRDYPNFDPMHPAKTCGTVYPCLKAARMKTLDTNFIYSDGSSGSGLPYDGLKAIGHGDGPSHSGRPAYVHQPLYLNGDSEVLSQQNNSHVELETSGNGIKIYRPVVAGDPGAFAESSDDYAQVTADTWGQNKGDDFRGYFDLEPASGLVVRSRFRLGKSYALYECDPLTNTKCGIARSAQGVHACYAETGDDLYNATSAAKKAEMAAAGETGFSYPCSAANVLTPDVVGGKVLPHDWSEEFQHSMTTDQIDELSTIALTYDGYVKSYLVMHRLGLMLALVGFVMAFHLLMFEETHRNVVARDEIVRLESVASCVDEDDDEK